MPRSRISREDWTLILERIHGKACVPFLGAGVNVSHDGYEGLPLGPELTRQLAWELHGVKRAELDELAEVMSGTALFKRYGDLARLGVEDLARVALHFLWKWDHPRLMQHLRSVLPDQDRQPSELLQTLARLPFRLIVTTNYDRLMERALEEAGTAFLPVVQPIGGFDRDTQAQLRDQLADWGEQLILYKIHGSFVDGDVFRRVIVTEEDYIEFLTVVGAKGGVPEAISKELRNTTLLFLGYGLEDWDIRTILKGIVETIPPIERPKSYAIQWKPSPFWAKFWEQKGVIIYHQDVHAFGKALDKKYREHEKRLQGQRKRR
jgi:hypothetical protein